jgi:hypothetical protein
LNSASFLTGLEVLQLSARQLSAIRKYSIIVFMLGSVNSQVMKFILSKWEIAPAFFQLANVRRCSLEIVFIIRAYLIVK